MKPSVPPFFWKILCVLTALGIWEIVAMSGVFSSFVFPSISSTLTYMVHNSEKLLYATWSTLKLLISGLSVSCIITLMIGALASMSEKGRAVVDAFLSILSPIPSISILPFAILWFGLGENPIIFITVFGSFCPFLINITNAFRTVNKKWIDVGKNYGLKGLHLIRHIILPASLPHVLTGFRAAWGIAWRSVVAAELVFGAVGGKGGLGWLIYVNRFQLNAPGMLATLFCISLIGIFMENVLLESIERKTVKKWGMKR
jgi:NitT/TauT family transport system permease protein